MMISEYRMYCSNCNSKGDDMCGYMWLAAKKVTVRVDLRKDSYEFRAKCPRCKKDIFNTRRAF
jgi:hypothetical protein